MNLVKNLDMTLLHHFVVTAELLSFTRASQTLQITKSKLSKDIRRLEDTLDTQLLERSSRVVRLTESGTILFTRAQFLLDECQHLLSDMTSLNHSVSGTLRLAASPALGRLISQQLLPDFIRRWPDVDVVLKLSYEYENLFQEGLDLAFRIGKNTDHNLIQKRLGYSHRVIVAAPAYLERQNVPRTVQALTQHRSVELFQRTNVNWLLETKTGVESVNVPPILRCEDFVSVINAVLAGVGIAQVPWFVAREHIQSGHLSQVLPDLNSPSLPIYAVYRQGLNKPKKVSEFIQHITHHESMFNLTQ
ncbi:LysR family transcriptional regulator [Alteromonas oceanisediminis]|uniref:LysR family transcriptional regulator n=1 Tax=Alteromonas oceanisediminis TaxID=2836180 RepID=UPI001BDB2C38|nr:LysR family transcriptional regulator [Alteromonas oceanisediminis]MBT0586981.1 LysR family transcriptional regulator [Alteromonas oceanisediminis]